MKKLRIFMMAFAVLFLLTACVGVTQKGTLTSQTASPVLEDILRRGELVVGTAGDMPPLNMTTKEGEVIGFEIDLAELIAEAMGVKLKVVTMPFADLLTSLDIGDVDMVISGMTITPGRNLRVAFVGPYFLSGKAVLTKIDTIAKVKEAEDIEYPGLTIAALNDSTSQYFVEAVLPDAKLIPTKNYGEAVDMVRQGKVHAMVADFPICVVSVFRYPDDGLLSVLTPLTYEPLGIAVPRRDFHFVNWLRNYLDTLDGSGQLDELREIWIEDASWLLRLP